MEQRVLELGDVTDPIGSVESRCLKAGADVVVGVDEVGRGPLAGPVTCAAVALDLRELAWCRGLDDSKRLSEGKRERWVDRIHASSVGHAVIHIESSRVDTLNILQASLIGMREAFESVVRASGDVSFLLVDGNRPLADVEGCRQRTIIKGDARSYAIAAASVLAKVARDHLMIDLDSRYPGYGFAQHKGYPTRQHREVLMRKGPCEIHRRSFRPVQESVAAFRGES